MNAQGKVENTMFSKMRETVDANNKQASSEVKYCAERRFSAGCCCPSSKPAPLDHAGRPEKDSSMCAACSSTCWTRGSTASTAWGCARVGLGRIGSLCGRRQGLLTTMRHEQETYLETFFPLAV